MGGLPYGAFKPFLADNFIHYSFLESLGSGIGPAMYAQPCCVSLF